MRFDIVTLFPEMINGVLEHGILGRAVRDELVEVGVWDLRKYAIDERGTVDDTPYGGGPGMVLRPEPVFDAVRDVLDGSGVERSSVRVVLMSPQGREFRQEVAREYAGDVEQLVLVCGRYEGFDERIREGLADEQLSIGEYVVQGGELPAMIVVEAVSRLIPGVLGGEESAIDESWSDGSTREYPQYTRPAEYAGLKVPDVLLSGDHAKIAQWREDNRR